MAAADKLKETLGGLKLIRDGLAAQGDKPEPAPRRGAVTQNTRPDLTPQAIQARPQQTWVRGKFDPIVQKLEQLIDRVEDASSTPENRASIPRLDNLTRDAVEVAEELNSVHRLSTVRMGKEDTEIITFEPILQKLLVVASYYANLAFYLTPQGHAWIRDVMKSGNYGEGPKERLRVKSHRLVENLTHDASEPFNLDQWKDWYLSNVEQGKDPVEHFVDYLLSFGFREQPTTPKARLGTDGDYRGVALARVRDGLPGSEDYPPKSQPRIFTFQVKVHGQKGDPGKLGEWWTIPTRFTQRTRGPAVLRPLELTQTEDRKFPGDFTKGSIYAMDGPDRMYCHAPSKHHTALMNGDAVSAAGMLVAEKGRIQAIDNRSGHYQPGYRQLVLAVRYLMANQLFESDAFVSLYVSDASALYFSPTEFVQVASTGLSFAAVTKFLSQQQTRFQQRLPVPARHVQLIPSSLSAYPVLTRKSGPINRWDLVLLDLYSGLKDLVTRLEEMLHQEETAVQPGGWVPGALRVSQPGGVSSSPAPQPASQRQGAATFYRQTATLAAHRLKAGGAYADLLPMLDQLVTTSAALAGPNGQPPVSTGVYKGLKAQAMMLRPGSWDR